MLLTARNLEKTFGPRLLFKGISLGVGEGERVGLVGANGSGKSTLLKIFAGVEQPDEGEIERKRNLVVAYVPQADSFVGETCLEVVSAVISNVHDEHEQETKAQMLLTRAGFENAWEEVSVLSGGWRKRLAIVRELAKGPELLLMDEPTNHLDLEGIEWLEDLIEGGWGEGRDFATLIVSHDRRFLEESANRIIELSRQYPEGYLSHNGTYSEFVEKREEFLAAQAGRQTAVASAVRREIEWLRRGAKARTTKAKGRIERAGDMMAELAQLKQRNASQGAAGVDFTASQRQTKKLVELKKVSKSLGGRTLFRDVNVVIGPGTRLGLLGPNGAGKSTMIKLLTGKMEADSGTIFRAEGLRVVVFDQHREVLEPTQTLRRALSPAGDSVQFQGQQQHVSGWAARFLFASQQLDMPVGSLSGGEQSRVLIARLMLQPADVLVLDEPTNDLDIPTLDVLEESLEGFTGAVVLVTHDRYLLDRLATDVLALDGEGGAAMYADLGQWERARADRERIRALEARAKAEESKKRSAAPVKVTPEAKKAAAEAAAQSAAKTAAKKRLSWNEQKELDGMERAIAAAEAEHARCAALAEDPTILADHTKSRAAFAKVAAAQGEVERLYARWEELMGG